MTAASSGDVENWLAELSGHPLEPVFRRVTDIILTADSRMAALIQYGTLHFIYKSDLGSFVQVKDRKRVALMFNAAGRLKGEFPHLEGRAVKYMYFTNLEEANARADELRAIVAAWVAYKK